MLTTSELIVYPVKSMRGLSLSHADVEAGGFPFDRIFMLTQPDGQFLTARELPHLVRFTPALLNNGISITAPDQQRITVQFDDFSMTSQPTQVWGDHFYAHIASIAVNQWLSHYMQQDVQLRWLGTQSTRRFENSNRPLSFVDGYPYLLVNQGSFEQLQQRCPAKIEMAQFRPNIVVSGAQPFAEDHWKTIRIGEVIFDLVKPCTRCVFLIIDAHNGLKQPQNEPIRTLQQFRMQENGDIDFGHHLIPRHRGIIKVGDQIEVLATQPPPIYRSQDTSLIHPADTQISITYAQHTFIGNNRQILLEQLEQQGFQIPYSCRAGICFQCKLRLKSGEVTALRLGAHQRNNMILSCSCIPKTTIVLE